MSTQPPASIQPRAHARRGPVFTALKIAWWALAIGVTLPILIGVIRGVLAS